ncbi:hypothetical protein BDR26DRAFT_1010693 [Obelidium mucronatum]|nr:hypothetical protein BDR26DRAFT_1010693 [Obelidium mucronatum]
MTTASSHRKRFSRPSKHTIAISVFFLLIVGGLIGLKLGNDQKTAKRKNRFTLSIGDNTQSLQPFNGPQPTYCEGIPFSLVLVAIEVYHVDFANSQMKLATSFAPCGSFVGSFDELDAFLSTNISLQIASTKSTYAKGQVLTDSLTTVFTDGDATSYPLDTYTSVFNIRGFSGPTNRPLPIAVIAFGAPQGFSPTFSTITNPNNTAVSLTITAHRTAPIVTFAVLIMAMIWILTLVATALAYSTWTVKVDRKLELPYLIVTISLLFAIPVVRNAMPAAPPVGVLADQMVTGWALLLLSGCVVSHFVNLLWNLRVDAVKAAAAALKEKEEANERDIEKPKGESVGYHGLTTILCLSGLFPASASNVLQIVYTCQVETQTQEAALHNFDVFNHRWGVGASVSVWPRTAEQTTSLLSLVPSCVPRTEPLHDPLIFAADEDQEAIRKRDGLDPFFHKFQRYDAFIEKLESWQKLFPELVTYIPSIVSTHEGRNVPAIIITDKSVPDTEKKMIWWNGLQHAREWISGSTVMYLCHQLLSLGSGGKGVDSTATEADVKTVQEYLKKFQFVVTPVNNPDGYEYTFTDDRYWRKNRRNNGDSDPTSFGVDLNRNWDDKWGVYGANKNIFSETYQGPSAFSEPETNGTAQFIQMFPNRYAGIDFHSYGELVLRNWGYTSTDSPNEVVLKTLGDGIRDAIFDVYQEVYTSEKGAGLYPASGCTDDWMSTEMGMVGFTIELRNTHSFELPVGQIPITGKEIWAGMRFFLNFLLEHPSIPHQVPSAVLPVLPALFPIINDGKSAPALSGASKTLTPDNGISTLAVLSIILGIVLAVILGVFFFKRRAVDRLKYSVLTNDRSDSTGPRGLKRSTSSPSSSSIELGNI